MAASFTSQTVVPQIQTLNETPKRVLAFLTALGTQFTLRALMKSHGYTQDDHLEGWRLLIKASGSGPEGFAPLRAAAADAIAELDAWDEVGFHKAHAALRRRHPVQAAFVFNDLAPSQGREAVLGVIRFLDRLDALENDPNRAGTRDEDKKALESLAQRGFDATERARLRDLVELAQSEPEISVDPNSAAATRVKDLADLYAWYAEWTEVARAVVPRRADRLAIGIARKKRSSRDDEEEETDEPEDTQPVPAVTQPAPAVTGPPPVVTQPANGAVIPVTDPVV